MNNITIKNPTLFTNEDEEEEAIKNPILFTDEDDEEPNNVTLGEII